MNKRPIFLLLIAGFTFAFAGIFEHYGLGKVGLNYSVSASGRGKSSLAYSDSLSVNMQNPASLAFIRNAGIEMSVQSNHNFLQGTGNTNNYTGFSYGTLKFPLTRKGAFILGIVPLSSANASYQILAEDYSEISHSLGNIYAATLGAGYALFPKKQVAFGVSADYLIGGYTITNDIEFESGSSLTPVRIERAEGFSGLQFSAGVNVTPFDFISIGASYTLPGPAARREITRYMAISSSYYYSYIDTAEFSDINIFPEQLRLGLALKLAPRYILTGDWVRYQFSENDADFSINRFYEGQATGPFQHYGVGIEKQGILSEYVPFHRSLTYRFGAFYDEHYLIDSEGTPIRTYGISLGLGIPFNQYRNRIDAAFVGEYNSGTIFGDAEGPLLHAREFVYHFTVSISIAETWFHTRGKFR